MKQNKKSLQIGLGITSILMIFVVLCMMVLSLLTYNEAKQKESIAQRQLEFQEAYAKADATMQFVIHEVLEQDTQSLDAVLETDSIAQLMKDANITLDGTGDIVRFAMPINTQQDLIATVKKTNGNWVIESYTMKENGE